MSSQLEILSQILNLLHPDSEPLDATLNGVWKSMGESFPDIIGANNFLNLKKAPFQIDGSKWSHLNFVEQSALNFEPMKGAHV